jgi:hypothetical protein
MDHADWGGIYHRILQLYATEPIELRILIGLGVALGVFFMLEGLRTSLHSLTGSRAQTAALTVQPVAPVAPAAKSTPPTPFVPRYQAAEIKPVRAKLRLVPANTVKIRVKPFRSAAPRFQRASGADKPSIMVTDEGAPYSPISPFRGKKTL